MTKSSKKVKPARPQYRVWDIYATIPLGTGVIQVQETLWRAMQDGDWKELVVELSADTPEEMQLAITGSRLENKSERQAREALDTHVETSEYAEYARLKKKYG